MEKLTKINLRIYGILIKDSKILFIDEIYAGKRLLKLPGGGLEIGEGPKQTLIREFKEELNLDVKIDEHFYTQDFFLKSELTPDSQLLSIYYKVHCDDFSSLRILEESISGIIWMPLKTLKLKDISLPVDKIVIKNLLDEKNN